MKCIIIPHTQSYSSLGHNVNHYVCGIGITPPSYGVLALDQNANLTPIVDFVPTDKKNVGSIQQQLH